MFEAWYNIFADNGAGGTQVTTLVTTGDNGTPAKDLGYLMKKVVTSSNELRIVVSS